MPEILFTPDGNPISAVRVVNPSLPITAGGNPVTAIRIMEAPTWSGSALYTPSGFPVRSVRLVDAAGAYTTSRTPVAGLPEDVFTPDGNPIEAVRIFSSVPSPEVTFTADRYPIEAVRLVDANGTVLGQAAETTSWASQVVTNGGTVSPNRQALIDQFIFAEKAAGTWALTDDYWALWGENPGQSLTSLKQLRLATAIGSPTFNASRDCTFNGTTSYLNSGFIPFSHAVAMTGTNMRVAGYERTAALGYTVGAVINSTLDLQMAAQGAGAINCGLNYSNTVHPIPGAGTSVGYSAVSRAGGGTIANAWKNGVALGGLATGAVGTALVNLALFIGARNSAGTPANFATRSIGLVCVGAPLSDAQELAQYRNVQAWASAIGAAV